jgi:hypothetical protein
MKPISRSAKLAVVTFMVGCWPFGSTSPDFSKWSGKYILESVDGIAVPTTVGPSSGCAPKTLSGELVLMAPSGATRPVYTLITATRPACETFLSHPLVDAGVVDVGQWDTSSEEIEFRSEKQLGSYQGVPSSSGSVTKIDTPIGGHFYTWSLVPLSDQSPGTLTVHIVDAAGGPVGNVLFEFTSAVRMIARGTTKADGVINLQSPPGSVSLAFAPPIGYSISQDQPNPILITLSAGREATVTIVLK